MQESISWNVTGSLCSSFLGVCLHYAIRRYNFSTQMQLASYNTATSQAFSDQDLH